MQPHPERSTRQVGKVNASKVNSRSLALFVGLLARFLNSPGKLSLAYSAWKRLHRHHQAARERGDAAGEEDNRENCWALLTGQLGQEHWPVGQLQVPVVEHPQSLMMMMMEGVLIER